MIVMPLATAQKAAMLALKNYTLFIKSCFVKQLLLDY